MDKVGGGDNIYFLKNNIYIKHMEKIKLTLNDLMQLESELNGLVDPKTGKVIYQGFLKSNLQILLKYELKELCNELRDEKKRIDQLRDELILKYGEDDGKGGKVVKTHNEIFDVDGNLISKSINENYLEFDKEFGELLSHEKEIEYPEITTADLKEAGKSPDHYVVLFKLIKKGA